MNEATKREELIKQIVQLTDETLRGMFSLLSHDWLQLDLTMPQLKVMFILFSSGSTRMGSIASALGVNLGTATGVVGRLVERGLVLRENHSEDRRVVLCTLSEKGRELMDRSWQISDVQHRKAMETMELAELQVLKDSQEAILQAQWSIRETLRRYKKDSNNQIPESAVEVEDVSSYVMT
jgi:DNA-binding MarR family transcriptional regulator